MRSSTAHANSKSLLKIKVTNKSFISIMSGISGNKLCSHNSVDVYVLCTKICWRFHESHDVILKFFFAFQGRNCQVKERKLAHGAGLHAQAMRL